MSRPSPRSRTSSGRIVAVLLSAAFLVAACGAGGGPATGPVTTAEPTAVTLDPPTDAPEPTEPLAGEPSLPLETAEPGTGSEAGACDLLDRAVAEAVVGGALEVQVDRPDICKLVLTGTPGSLVLEVTLGNGADTYEHELALLGMDQEVAGLGERAFRSGNILAWELGDAYLALTVIPGSLRRVSTDELLSLAEPVVAGLTP
jgi:hypothetical protein